jgi:hypothetical protein
MMTPDLAMLEGSSECKDVFVFVATLVVFVGVDEQAARSNDIDSIPIDNEK